MRQHKRFGGKHDEGGPDLAVVTAAGCQIDYQLAELDMPEWLGKADFQPWKRVTQSSGIWNQLRQSLRDVAGVRQALGDAA